MNGWAFGPNDFPYFCTEQNRPADSAEQGCKFHQLLAGTARLHAAEGIPTVSRQ
jgi:hypothetical protein